MHMTDQTGTIAVQLVRQMNDYVRSQNLPVILSLCVESSYEVSVERLAVYPDHLRQGYGSQVMSELTRRANELDVDLVLLARPEERDEPEEEIPLPALTDFYKRFGFNGDYVSGSESTLMYRQASSAPSIGLPKS